MTTLSDTPAATNTGEHKIHKRNWKFGRGMEAQRWWHSNDAGRTAFFNALSSTFPVGERFFMTAVRHYRDDVPEHLRGEIDDFIFQESTHSREHVFFNTQARNTGFDIKPAEDRAARTIVWARKRSPIMQLAATCVLEHFTAILANAVLSNPAHLAGADDEAQRMWCWHAVEEIEHKAVAYDTWLHATRAMPGWKRWALRSIAMLGAAVRFHFVVFRNTAGLLKQDKRNNLGTWWKLLGYLYGRPGAMRRLAFGIFGYFRPGFHPWQHDDRVLSQSALEALTPYFSKPAEEVTAQ